jgi:uncharacterized membrane protein YgcG
VFIAAACQLSATTVLSTHTPLTDKQQHFPCTEHTHTRLCTLQAAPVAAAAAPVLSGLARNSSRGTTGTAQRILEQKSGVAGAHVAAAVAAAAAPAGAQLGRQAAMLATAQIQRQIITTNSSSGSGNGRSSSSSSGGGRSSGGGVVSSPVKVSGESPLYRYIPMASHFNLMYTEGCLLQDVSL